MMGTTVPAYSWALEDEINKRRSFRKALANQAEREAFDEIIKMCKNNSSVSDASCNHIIFEPIAMSILMAQTKKRQEPESPLNEFLWQKTCQTTEDQKHKNSREPELESKNPN